MADERIDGAVLTLDGRPVPPELYPRLLLVQVDESVHLPDAFEIRFEDAHFRLFDDAKFKLGGRLEIAMRTEGDPVLITTCEITAIAVDQGHTGRHELILTGFDLTHRLAQAPKRRTFQRMSDADIAEQIAADYALRTDIESDGQVHEYVLQANETDLGFLRRRAARSGYDFWVSDDTMHLKPKPVADGATPTVRWGENLLRCSVRFSMRERCDEVVVRGWDPLSKEVVLGTALRQAQGAELGTDAPAAAEMAEDAKAAFGTVQRYATRFPVTDQAEAEALAKSLLLRASGEEVQVRGEAQGNPQLAAGGRVRIEGMGERMTGEYQVTSVRHTLRSGRPYSTTFHCGGRESSGLTDLLGQGSAAQPAAAEGSLMVGQVTNNDDPEQLGRVKVTFPTLSDSDESSWARLASPGAGPRRGMQWSPEINDEVLVGFELGDTTRPIVLGGLWNRSDEPPAVDLLEGGQVKGRVLVSRNDHRLTLIDDPTGAVELSMGDAQSKLHLEKSDSALEAEGKLVISARQIEIRAQQQLIINGTAVKITASGDLAVSGKPIKLN